MPESIDELLATIRSLTERIDQLDADDRKRTQLELKREKLRETARDAADASRHPEDVTRQIEALEHRLAEINQLLIKQGYTERRVGRTIQDPSAYSANINRAIEADHVEEVRSIKAQLVRLRKAQTDSIDSR